MEKQKGIVRWFDKLSGHGVITGDDGQSYRVYACNIIGAKTCFEHTACMFLTDDTSAEFQVHSECGAFNVTGGVFDNEKWERIKDSNLSFRKDDQGNIISGLFE
jgi:hypothetical protein